MPTHRLVTLGRFECGGEDGVALPIGKLAALLVYLADCNSEPHHRDKLSALLWGSHFDPQAQQNFRKSLSRLRAALGSEAIVAEGEFISLRRGVVDSDVAQFEALAADGSEAALRAAVQLYQGHFLANLTIEQALWKEWVTARRRQLARKATEVFVQLATIDLSRGFAEQAVEKAQRAIGIDRFHEEAHRIAIAAQAATGRRAQALRHFAEFQADLKSHLAIAPDAQTVALVESLRVTGAAEQALDVAAAPERPTLAVLPFDTVGSPPFEDYLVDGIVDELINDFSRLRWLGVISRKSSMLYKNRDVDVRDVGSALQVRYVLTGRIQIEGSKIRISTQLLDSSTGFSLFSHRFERQRGDIFALQEDIAATIAAALEPGIRGSEIERVRRKPPSHLGAYDLFLRAQHEIYKLKQHNYARAVELLSEAVAVDPDYSDAWAALADCRVRQWSNGWLPTEDRERVTAEGVDYAQRAALADPQNGMAIAILAYAFVIMHGRFEEALELVDRAHLLQPNSDYVLTICGQVVVNAGQFERAIMLFEKARRLNPVDPRSHATLNGIAMAHFHSNRFAEAERWARLALAERPNWNVARRYRAAALAHLGRMGEAAAEIAELLVHQPNASIARSRYSQFGQPFMYDQYLGGLRLAGLPEE